MSETSTTPTGPNSGPHEPLYPAELLIELIIVLLTPLFLAVAGGDLAFARVAAAETLESYRAETHADLITIAKIIAFGLATLGSLSLSMDDGRSVPQILRLRSSANATDRSEHRNRATLDQSRKQHAAELPPEPEIDLAALAAADTHKRTAENLAKFAPQPPSPAPKSAQAATGAHQHHAATWAASFAQVARETAADLDSLPEDERRSAALWVEVLNDSAKAFMAGDIAPRPSPGDLAAMMRGA
jgi:hypothetical protein